MLPLLSLPGSLFSLLLWLLEVSGDRRLVKGGLVHFLSLELDGELSDLASLFSEFGVEETICLGET